MQDGKIKVKHKPGNDNFPVDMLTKALPKMMTEKYYKMLHKPMNIDEA